MKKARLMLGVIAVLAIAGGVFAGTKAKSPLKVVYVQTQPGAAICESTLSTRTFANEGAFVTQTQATLIKGQPCALRSIYVAN